VSAVGRFPPSAVPVRFATENDQLGPRPNRYRRWRWPRVNPPCVADLRLSGAIDANELAAQLLSGRDGLVDAVRLPLKIPVEGADNDPVMSIGLEVEANEIAPIECEQRTPLRGCECQDFRVGYGIACPSRIHCRQHIVTEFSQGLDNG
jgi:hypothetical protein